MGQPETLQYLMDLQHTILKIDHREYCWQWIGVLVVLMWLVVGCYCDGEDGDGGDTDDGGGGGGGEGCAPR